MCVVILSYAVGHTFVQPSKTLLAKKLTMQIFCCKLETPIKNPAGAAHHWDR